MIRKVLFHLVRIVESNISKDLEIAKQGAIMHDGWSKSGTHYVSLFAQYNRTVMQNTGKIRRTVLVPASVLLAMRPMAGILDKNNEDLDDDLDSNSSEDEEEEVKQQHVPEEATTFTAEVHAEFFKDVMKKYNVVLEDWAVCQVSILIFLFPFNNSHYLRSQTAAVQILRQLDSWEYPTYHAITIS